MREYKYNFIYMTTNMINGKKYIGKCSINSNPETYHYLGSGKVLKQAIKKYGVENFKREIIHYSKSYEENKNMEKYFIEKYNACISKDFYNVAAGGDGGDLSKGLTDKQKLLKSQKISQSLKGNKYWLGKQHKPETKQKISKTKQGKKLSDNAKRNIANGHKKAILCIDDNKIFNSKKEAMEHYGIMIYSCCVSNMTPVGKKKYKNGLTFKYVEE